MSVISSALRVSMRFFTLKYFAIPSLCVKSYKFAQGGQRYVAQYYM